MYPNVIDAATVPVSSTVLTFIVNGTLRVKFCIYFLCFVLIMYLMSQLNKSIALIFSIFWSFTRIYTNYPMQHNTETSKDRTRRRRGGGTKQVIVFHYLVSKKNKPRLKISSIQINNKNKSEYTRAPYHVFSRYATFIGGIL